MPRFPSSSSRERQPFPGTGKASGPHFHNVFVGAILPMQFVALGQVILRASTGKASGTRFSNPFVNATLSAEFVDELSFCQIPFVPFPR